MDAVGPGSGVVAVVVVVEHLVAALKLPRQRQQQQRSPVRVRYSTVIAAERHCQAEEVIRDASGEVRLVVAAEVEAQLVVEVKLGPESVVVGVVLGGPVADPRC